MIRRRTRTVVHEGHPGISALMICMFPPRGFLPIVCVSLPFGCPCPLHAPTPEGAVYPRARMFLPRGPYTHGLDVPAPWTVHTLRSDVPAPKGLHINSPGSAQRHPGFSPPTPNTFLDPKGLRSMVVDVPAPKGLHINSPGSAQRHPGFRPPTPNTFLPRRGLHKICNNRNHPANPRHRLH
jgi:hypothetical protein